MTYFIITLLSFGLIINFINRSVMIIPSLVLLVQYVISEIVTNYYGLRGDNLIIAFCVIDLLALTLIVRATKFCECELRCFEVKLILSSLVFVMLVVHAFVALNVILEYKLWFNWLNALSLLAAIISFIHGVAIFNHVYFNADNRNHYNTRRAKSFMGRDK